MTTEAPHIFAPPPTLSAEEILSQFDLRIGQLKLRAATANGPALTPDIENLLFSWFEAGARWAEKEMRGRTDD